MLEGFPDGNHNSMRDELAQHAFLADMASWHIAKLAACAQAVDLSPGHYIWRQGQRPEMVYLVSRGRVALEIQIPNQGALEVESIREGEFLPWLWLGGVSRRRFDARAVLPTRVLVLDGRKLRALCEQDHEFGYQLLKRFARATEDRLQAARLHILELQGHAPAR